MENKRKYIKIHLSIDLEKLFNKVEIRVLDQEVQDKNLLKLNPPCALLILYNVCFVLAWFGFIALLYETLHILGTWVLFVAV